MTLDWRGGGGDLLRTKTPNGSIGIGLSCLLPPAFCLL